MDLKIEDEIRSWWFVVKFELEASAAVDRSGKCFYEDFDVVLINIHAPCEVEVLLSLLRAKAGVDTAVVDVWQREVNKLSNRKFTHRLTASQRRKLCYGNRKMGFQAYFRVESWGFMARLLAKHQRDASDPAFEPGRPHLIYTCGEDRLVQHIYPRTEAATELLRCQPICGCSVRTPVIPLYAIAIDPRNLNVFAVVGLDQYAHLYDIRKYKCGGSNDFGQPIDYFYPPHVIVNTNGIFRRTCLASLDQSELLVSEANGKGTPQVYQGHGKKEMVDSVSFFG
ncbi:hypothetical protein V6N13_122070 [Hibiscus sabdariffa]